MNMNAFVYILPVFVYECLKEFFLKKILNEIGILFYYKE